MHLIKWNALFFYLFIFLYSFQTCGVSDRSYSYGETRAYSQRFAFACLGQLGLTKGDVIGLILPNIPEYVLAIFGGIEAGLVVTFANPLYTPGWKHFFFFFFSVFYSLKVTNIIIIDIHLNTKGDKNNFMFRKGT